MSQLSTAKESALAEWMAEARRVGFWEGRFLPRWLPLILAVGVGALSGLLIVRGQWSLLVPTVLAVPTLIMFTRFPFAAVIMWILVLPFFVVTPTAAERFAYWIMHRGLIPATLLIVVIANGLRVRKREMIRFGLPELSLLLFVLIAVANILTVSAGGANTFIRFYDRLIPQFSLYLLIRVVAPTKDEFKKFLPAALFILVFECIIGLLTWFAPAAVPVQWLSRVAGERTTGTLANVATFTSTLLFLALPLFHYAMHCRSRFQRGVIVTAFGLTCFSVFFSFSRGSWLAGVVVLIVLFLMYRRVIASISILVLTLTLILGGTVLADEIAFANERLNDASTAQGRIVGNMASLLMIEAKPFTGWGYDDYNLYNTEFKARVGEIAVDQKGTSHNTYLTIMAELGVPAFIFFMLPTLWWLRLTLRAWPYMPRKGFWSRRLVVMFWLALLSSFIVSNFMDMVRFNPFGTSVYWASLGFIANLVYPYLQPENRQTLPQAR